MKQRRLTKKEINSIPSQEGETIEMDLGVEIETFFEHLPINLDLAGIFYVTAFINISQGKKEYKRLLKEIDRYNKFYATQAKKYPTNSEEFTTRMIPKLRNIEIFYEPVIRHFSTAKILLVSSAETFVNEVATVCVKGRKLDEFDKLSIVGKWLFIQDLLKLRKKFSTDVNPLQGFNSLVKERNKLVHFKGMKRSIRTLEIPKYINELKLNPIECESNLNSVKELLSTLTLKWRGSYGPDWLYINETNFRNPCFYMGSRDMSVVLYSDEYDKTAHPD